MSPEKPSVKMTSLLKWIDCPRKVFFEKHSKERRFDYKSFLRYMLLGTLKYGYSEIGSSGKLNLAKYTGIIWENILKKNNFPSPASLLRQMNEFYSERKDAFTFIGEQHPSDNAIVNKYHWWDIGIGFKPKYYEWRDEINSWQHLLGFPPINIVKAYAREFDYYPMTLADVYADYMDAIRNFETRSIPASTIRFDVPVSLNLNNVILESNIDVLWVREKAYKTKTGSLDPGNIAVNFIYGNQFTNFDMASSLIRMTYDIRYPIIGVDYIEEDGSILKLDANENFIISSVSRKGAWDEDHYEHNRETKDAMLEKLDQYAYLFYRANSLNLGVPKIAPHDFHCAGCSYLEDCFMPGRILEDIASDYMKEDEAEALAQFQDSFIDDASVCDNRIDAMDLLLKSLHFLRDNHDAATIDGLTHISENLKDRFLVERNKSINATTKKKI